MTTSSLPEYDYADLELVAGLEIHQQLDTSTKLFCQCPTRARDPDDASRRLHRYLHPTPSELGEMDAAALEESRVDRRFEYLGYDTTCLVEEDDEPPHEMDEEALGIAMQVASLLDMVVVDEAHVMRKIVVDGSNTTGFQRSTLLATDGSVETPDGAVGITDLMLEEESARRIEETESGVRYGLDRLGIPLIEIGTAPDIRSPGQAKATARRIGMLLRSTGAVKRGIGTIRQDVNVSIEAGARVELKGVQDLGRLDDIVALEAHRQVRLLELRDRLREREAAVGEPTTVTGVFEDTDSGVIRSTLEEGGAVFAVALPGFAGIVGAAVQPDRRLGSELADHARRHGAGGIFHTDELPGYGITAEEVDRLSDRLAIDLDTDAVALVAADQETAALAAEAVADRARAAIRGVPEETRGVRDDGTSRYLRPLPGAARMYPETDVPPVRPDRTDVEPPELLTEKVDRYVTTYELATDLAEQIAYAPDMPIFERAVEERGIDPTLAARTLTGTLTELDRDGVAIDRLSESALLGAMAAVDAGEVPNEGLSALLRELAADPAIDIETAVERAEVGTVDDAAVRETVRAVVERNEDQIEAEGMGAFSAMMGECMAELRGNADGELVSDLLREEIQRVEGAE